MLAATRAPLTLDQMALRRDERALLAGGTGTGKSKLARYLRANFLARYAKSRSLVLDSKPRFIAPYYLNGITTARRFRNWSHGELVADAVLITPETDPDPVAALKNARKLGWRTVVAQGPDDIIWLVACARAFLTTAKRNEPQLLDVDETMDFYHANGVPKGGNAVDRSARAGRELGSAGLYCSQRTRMISTTLLQEMQRLYCFRLDYVADAKRFADFGCPPFTPPEQDFVFDYWHKRQRRQVFGPYQLALPPDDR
jgi:hypothetical protein